MVETKSKTSLYQNQKTSIPRNRSHLKVLTLNKQPSFLTNKNFQELYTQNNDFKQSFLMLP